MSKTLVTGGDGFIGSHLIEELLSSNRDIKALVLYNSFSSWGWLDDLKIKKDIEIVSGDIRDPDFCNNLLSDVSEVFNLAALIAIPYSYSSPRSYIDTNVIGTLNLCQSALKSKVEKFVQMSTSEVYGTAEYVPINENHPLKPQSPYSASKIGSDSIAMSFYHSFKLPLTIARPFNTYGPRQSARAVIPSIISQIASNKKTVELGTISPTRDFTYVLDTCRAMIAVSDHLIPGEVFNIGTNFEISIEDLLIKISKMMDAEITYDSKEERKRPENSEVERLWCDNTKLKELIKFSDFRSIDEGLEETIEWFSDEENLSKYKPDQYNV